MGTTFEITDEEVRKALDGNKGLFGQLVHSYTRRLMAVLQGRGVSLNDIEDCTQHTFMRLWENKNTIRGNNIFSWLCTTALNRSYEIQRKTRRLEFIGDTEVFDSIMPLGEEIVTDENRIAKLRAAIATLEEPYQKIIRMQLAGRSYKEMAQILDCPINTIGTRRLTAINILQGKMKKHKTGLGNT